MTAKELIAHQEDKRLDLYQCPAGRWTIGIGHNLEAKGISDAVAELMFKEDMLDAVKDARAVVRTFDGLCEVRQAVFLSMVFCMGRAGLATFKKAIDAANRGAYHDVAAEIRDSRWCREQESGDRPEVLAQMMEFGRWPNTEN